MRPLTHADAAALAAAHGTPLYLYDAQTLVEQARAALAFPNAFGLTVRYAVKAAANAAILRLFAGLGLHFDASSGWEAHRLLRAGIPGAGISLSAQELPDDFAALARLGVSINACSLQQLDRYGAALPGAEVGLRFNPGLGSGSSRHTNVGGPGSSFGIWHEHIPAVRALLQRHGLTPFRVHTHIGSGADPAVWQRAATLSLDTVRAFPAVRVFNLGGGFKVARMPDETGTDLQVVGAPIAEMIRAFAAETGRRLHFEIEPGTFLVANAGAVLARVHDVTDTGPAGRRFLKLDTGMTEILRPALYGARHPISILQATPATRAHAYVVVGHCCESGDILSTAPGEPAVIATRQLPAATPGDFALIGGAGAYCSAMAAQHYNSFPAAPELLREADGAFRLIRRRQTLDDVVAHEL